MNFLAFITGAVYTVSFLVVFFSIYKQSKFWVLFISIEYFYFLGLGVFPIALSIGYADFPKELAEYGGLNSFNVLTFFHVIFYSIGALTGFFLVPRLKFKFSRKLERFSVRLNIDSGKTVVLFLALAYTATIIYIYLVGADRVFLGAALARGGDLVEFSGFEQYLFLTRFVYFGVYAVAFLPYIMHKTKYPFLYLGAFFILGSIGYFMLAARYMLFQCVLVPMLFYLAYSKRVGPGSIFALVFIAFLGVLGVFYGKELPTVLANYLFNNGNFEFSYSGEDVNFFHSFSQFFYSIDVGIGNFFQEGPHVSKDIFLGPLGVLPSSTLSNIGLSDFSYILLDPKEKFACVNTKLITGSYSSCFMPPYYIGVSAYVVPLVGGLLFGFVRFFFYSVFSDCWKQMVGREQYLSIIVIVAISIEQLMLFIPNSAAFVSLVSVVLSLLIFSGLFITNNKRRI